MKFDYQARTADGEVQTGVVEASSQEAALSLLQSYGLFITSLEGEVEAPFYSKKIEIFQKISGKDIVAFFRQLAILFKSSVPVVESLQTIASQTKKQSFREKIMLMAEKVEGGTSFSQALALFPQVFSPFSVGVIKSGETAGKLTEVLSYLADHTERDYNFHSKLVTAMVYPSFVFFVFVAVLVLMSIFIVPQLSQVFLETGESLPLITQIVIGFFNFFRNYWWLILIIILGLYILISRLIRTKGGKASYDKMSLTLPVLGDFLKKIYLSRIAENLSTLISAGFPIVQALEVTSEVVRNDIYRDIILETKEGVKKGEPISSLLSRRPEFFPPLFIQMITIGEKTGQLDLTLMNVVNYYQGEIERSLDSFVKLLEPIMIVCLGLVVALLMTSILLPLYQIHFV